MILIASGQTYWCCMHQPRPTPPAEVAIQGMATRGWTSMSFVRSHRRQDQIICLRVTRQLSRLWQIEFGKYGRGSKGRASLSPAFAAVTDVSRLLFVSARNTCQCDCCPAANVQSQGFRERCLEADSPALALGIHDGRIDDHNRSKSSIEIEVVD